MKQYLRNSVASCVDEKLEVSVKGYGEKDDNM